MMKMSSFAPHKYVPIPEWAQKRAFFAILFAFTALCACAAQEHKEMENLYRQLGDTPSDELYKTGRGFLEENKLDEAMVCFSIVGNRYSPNMTDEEKRLCAYSLNNAGGISQLRSNYSIAFSYFKKAIQIADEPIYQAYNNIAGIYLFYNDYKNARQYLTQAFDISLEQKNWESLSNSLQNLIFLGWKMDSLASLQPQIERYRSVDSIPPSLSGYTIGIADGTIAASKGQYREAIRIFSGVINADSTILSANHFVYNTPLYIAKCYMALKDYPLAMQYLKTVEEEMRRIDDYYMLMYVYNLQIECCQQDGNAEGARKAKYDLLNLKDSINTVEELEKIKNIEFFDEVDKYEKQVVELSHQKNTRTRVAIISCLALLVVALLFIVAIIQNRRLRESNKELYRKTDELVRQADSEKLQRTAYKKKIDGFIEKIASLQGTINTLRSASLPASSTPIAEEPTTAPAASSPLPDDQSAIVEKIYQQLDDVEFICQPDLTVERLAQAIGIHDRYVSQVINESTNKNFNTLLNEYRIREACKRLTDFDTYGQMTNETIAEGLGYKSRSHFIRTFKKMTGLTPSQYQKIAREEQQ
ncbi:MAG: helix-turn-helix domain-containing protein [Prevotella sp.]|nr:helix-turn-helix domain-containing protein [Prevotella sp.]